MRSLCVLLASVAVIATAGLYRRQEYTDERRKNMPKMFPMLSILRNWPTDDVTIPKQGVFDSLEHLDYQKPADKERAEYLRGLEIPFIVHNVPNINQVVSKWKDDDYLINGLGGPDKKFEVHRSHNNHFMYYQAKFMRREVNRGKRPKGGYASEKEAKGAFRAKGYTAPHPPPVPVRMTLAEFWNQTRALEEKHSLAEREDYEHLYLTTGDSYDGGPTVIGKDIDIWRSKNQGSLFVVDNSDMRGMHCRFGMRGIIAECHEDGHLNFIAMLRGAKRYILNPPSACPYLGIMHEGPSRRHTALDLSKPEESKEIAGQLQRAESVEVIVRAGDILYVPSFWYHHIVSLGRSVQCNTRSGVSPLFGDEYKSMLQCDNGTPPKPLTAAESKNLDVMLKQPAEGPAQLGEETYKYPDPIVPSWR